MSACALVGSAQPPGRPAPLGWTGCCCPPQYHARRLPAAACSPQAALCAGPVRAGAAGEQLVRASLQPLACPDQLCVQLRGAGGCQPVRQRQGHRSGRWPGRLRLDPAGHGLRLFGEPGSSATAGPGRHWRAGRAAGGLRHRRLLSSGGEPLGVTDGPAASGSLRRQLDPTPGSAGPAAAAASGWRPPGPSPAASLTPGVRASWSKAATEQPSLLNNLAERSSGHHSRPLCGCVPVSLDWLGLAL